MNGQLSDTNFFRFVIENNARPAVIQQSTPPVLSAQAREQLVRSLFNYEISVDDFIRIIDEDANARLASTPVVHPMRRPLNRPVTQDVPPLVANHTSSPSAQISTSSASQSGTPTAQHTPRHDSSNDRLTSPPAVQPMSSVTPHFLMNRRMLVARRRLNRPNNEDVPSVVANRSHSTQISAPSTSQSATPTDQRPLPDGTITSLISLILQSMPDLVASQPNPPSHSTDAVPGKAATSVVAKRTAYIARLREENEQSSTRKVSRTCAICLTDSPLRRVVLIERGHSMCLACAEQLKLDAKNQKFNCPFCRTKTTFVPLIESFDE